MKKASVIILCSFYLLVACGVNFSLHFCGGKFKGISLTQRGEAGCCGSKKKSMGCCKEKSVVLKVKTDHQATSKVLIPDSPSKHLFAAFVVTDFKIQNPVIDLFAVPECNAPPFYDSDPVYLLNKNFRI